MRFEHARCFVEAASLFKESSYILFVTLCDGTVALDLERPVGGLRLAEEPWIGSDIILAS